MLTSRNGVEIAAGVSGSGKTKSTKESLTEWLEDHGRAIILDNAGDDWPGDDFYWDGGCALARDAANARRLIKQGWQCVVIRPGPPVFYPVTWQRKSKDEPDTAPIIEHACNIVIEESSKDRPLALVVSEAQISLPNKPLSEHSQALYLITNYRHRGAAVILDAQRIAKLSPDARAQARTLRAFAMSSPQDMDALHSIHADLPAAVARCTALSKPLSPWDAGGGAFEEPGWHIQLDPRAANPPFIPQRWNDDTETFVFADATE